MNKVNRVKIWTALALNMFLYAIFPVAIWETIPEALPTVPLVITIVNAYSLGWFDEMDEEQ